VSLQAIMRSTNSPLVLQLRPADCDSLGHVNNAAYVAYLQHALAEFTTHHGLVYDWRDEPDHIWSLRSMAIEYRQPAVFGDTLTAEIWVAIPEPLRPVFGCEIRKGNSAMREDQQASIVRSRSAWSRIARTSGEVVPAPDGLLAASAAEEGLLPRRFRLPNDSEDVRHYSWEHRVMRAEVDTAGRAQPQSIYRWLEQSVFQASARAGWPIERWLQTGYMTLQTRHDTEFLDFPGAGDPVRITSRLVEVRRLRGTWFSEIRNQMDGTVLARDYSTGVFLNLAGRPAAPPARIFQDIQFGQ
jgi:YbgC/YbaW family acyl-CoA thioester hydrolase